MLTVPVVLLLAAAVILVGVVGVAMGRGGEMAEFSSDYLPPTLDDVVTADDVASMRPPSSLWGYNVRVTDEALHRIAQVVTERDVEIAVLRQQLAELRSATDAGTSDRPAPIAPDIAATDDPAAVAPDRSAGQPVEPAEPAERVASKAEGAAANRDD
jgi:hypothetical protein